MINKNTQQILNFNAQILSDTIYFFSFLTDSGGQVNTYLSKIIYAVFAENKESFVNFFNQLDDKGDYAFSKKCNLLFLAKAYKLIKNSENFSGHTVDHLHLIPFSKLSLKEKSLLFFKYKSSVLLEDFAMMMDLDTAETINLISLCNQKMLEMLGENTNSFFIQEGCVHSRNYYAYVESDIGKSNDDFLTTHILECDICKKNLIQFQKITKIVDAHLPLIDKNDENKKELNEMGAELIHSLYQDQMDKEHLRVAPKIVKKIIKKITNIIR